MRNAKWIMLFGAAASLRLAAAGMTLATAGSTDWSIVVRAEAPALEREAAADLSRHLEAITGAKFPLDASGKHRIFLGVRAPGDAKAMQPAERRIRAAGGDLYLYGENSDGAPFAVYDLLEKKLGCRWFTPWGDEVIPKAPTLSIEEPDGDFVPSFRRFETASLGEYHWNTKVRDFLRRRRIHIAPDRIAGDDHYTLGFPLHTFCKYLPSGRVPPGKIVDNIGGPYKYFEDKKYFETNPEFFTLDSRGKRVPNRQLCLSNPQLRRELTRNLETVIAREYRGGAALIAVDMNDRSEYLCRCPGCRALEKKYETPGGPLYDYLIELGELFLVKYPGIVIRSLAYGCSLKPPNRPLPANVMMWYAPLHDRDFLKNYEETVPDTALRNLKRQAAVSTGGLWSWYYTSPFRHRHFTAPLIADIQRIADDLRILRRHKVCSLMTEFGYRVCGTDAFNELRLHLMGALVDDLSRSEAEVVREFTDCCYGAAAGAVRRYLAELETLGRGSKMRLDCFPTRPMHLDYVTPARLVRWDKEFDAMESLVADDLRRRNAVRRVRRNLDETVLGRWGELAAVDPAYTTEAFYRRRQRYLDAVRASSAELCGGFPREAPAKTRARLDREVARRDANVADRPLENGAGLTPRRPLPPEFAAIPAERIFRVPFLPQKGGAAPADPDGAFGMSMPGTALPVMRFGMRPDRTLFPIPLTIEKMRARQPGKFHCYHLGSSPLDRAPRAYGTVVTKPHSAALLEAVADPADPDRLYDFYVSVKFVPPDRIWLDELLVIRSR